MSKAEPSDNRNSKSRVKEPPLAPAFKPPLRPRRGLFYGLLGLLVLWVVALVILYVRTVYPTHNQQQHAAPVSAPTAVENAVPR
jgi:uncharacterized SAM-binding protein YcdF (DUF218 family)